MSVFIQLLNLNSRAIDLTARRLRIGHLVLPSYIFALKSLDIPPPRVHHDVFSTFLTSEILSETRRELTETCQKMSKIDGKMLDFVRKMSDFVGYYQKNIKSLNFFTQIFKKNTSVMSPPDFTTNFFRLMRRSNCSAPISQCEKYF